MPSGKRCTSCGAVGVPAGDPDSLCRPCRIGKDRGAEARREYLRNIGRKGGLAATRSRMEGAGLSPSDLPPLTSRSAAVRWLALTAEGVATVRLTAAEGETLRSLVADFLDALEEDGGGADPLEEYIREKYGGDGEKDG